jgi:transcriptional regulator
MQINNKEIYKKYGIDIAVLVEFMTELESWIKLSVIRTEKLHEAIDKTIAKLTENDIFKNYCAITIIFHLLDSIDGLYKVPDKESGKKMDKVMKKVLDELDKEKIN